MSGTIVEHWDAFVYIAVFFPMAAAIPVYIAGRYNKELRDTLIFLTCGLELSPLLFLFVVGWNGVYGADARIAGICDLGLWFLPTGFRVLYGTIAAVMWFLTTLFSKEYFAHYRNRNRYGFFLLLTLGATEGVFFANNFFTAFLFFEIMSFTSFVWVAHDERKESIRAAETYLGVAVVGGLAMMAGIALLYSSGGLSEGQIWAAGICILIGFGAKAGAFPLHIWLPKAHPVAPAPASALLSGVLTKAGICGILMLSTTLFVKNGAWGCLILCLGVATMVLGAVLALFSVDLKRTLACSSVSQIGFILVGIGMAVLLQEENALAVRGSILHMVNHSFFKLTLFMAAGVVFMNVHKLNLNDIRGFGRNKPLLHYIFLTGALGISGVPLLNGYVSKTLLHESIVEYTEILHAAGAAEGFLTPAFMKGVEWAFLISGGLTAAYMTKLYVAIFVEKNASAEVQKKYDALQGNYMNHRSRFALVVSATILPILGLFPNRVMGRLADMGQGIWKVRRVSPVIWFSPENLKGACISLAIGALVYILIVRGWMVRGEGRRAEYVNRWYVRFDLEDLIYRPILLKALPFVCGFVCRVLDSLVDGVVVLLRKTIYRDSKLPVELEEGTPLTHLAGCIVNAVRDLGNRTWRKDRPDDTDYEHKFALLYEELTEDRIIIARSLSFGLLLFCAGLIITMVYLLVLQYM